MGASLNYNTFPDTEGKAAIAKEWSNRVATSLYEDGHSYSGAIGMLGAQIRNWNDLNLPDESAAEEYLCDHHDKWSPAIAISFQRDGAKHWMVGGWCAE